MLIFLISFQVFNVFSPFVPIITPGRAVRIMISTRFLARSISILETEAAF